MNKRIKRLAKRAGFVFWGNESYKPPGQVIDWACDYDKELIKFAKLVIDDYVKSNSSASMITVIAKDKFK